MDWSYVGAPAEEPECDTSIYISGTGELSGDEDWFRFYVGSGLVRLHTGGTDTWYYGQSDGQEYDAGTEARQWYDSVEHEAAVDATIVTPEMLEEAREKYDIPPVDDDPAHQDFALVAWVWSEQLAENLRNLEPDSLYAVLDAQDDVASAQSTLDSAWRDLFSARNSYRWAVEYGLIQGS